MLTIRKFLKHNNLSYLSELEQETWSYRLIEIILFTRNCMKQIGLFRNLNGLI